jgi:hypothetical protein
MVDGEWAHIGSFPHVGSHSAAGGSGVIAGLSFDPLEERLWLADGDGYLASYALPDCSPYCSVRSCWGTTYDDADWGITSLPRIALRPVACASGVALAIGCALRLYSRGGVLEADVHVSALERVSGAVAVVVAPPAAPGGAPGGGGAPLRSSPAGLNVVLPIDSADPRGGAPSSGKMIVGGKLASGCLHLLDSARLWAPGAARVVHSGGGAVFAAGGGAGGGGGGGGASTVRVLQSFSVGHSVGVAALGGGDGGGGGGGGAAGRGGVLAAASGDGPELSLFDGALRTPAPVCKLYAHPGGTFSLDAGRNTLATAGYSNALPAGGGGGYAGPPGAATPPAEAAVRLFDIRMNRQYSTLSVPAAGRWGGPLGVRLLPPPPGAPPYAAPQLAVLTQDGRLFSADTRADRLFTPRGAIAHAASGGDGRLRLHAAALAPSGAAWAATDGEGVVHVLAPGFGLATSLFGGAAPPAALGPPGARGARRAASLALAAPDCGYEGGEEGAEDGGLRAARAGVAEPDATSRAGSSGGALRRAAAGAAVAAAATVASAAFPPLPGGGAAAAAAAAAEALFGGGGGSWGGSFSSPPLAGAAAAAAAAAAAEALAPSPSPALLLPSESPPPTALGNAGGMEEEFNDASWDAALLYGAGAEVPVAAPGLGALASAAAHGAGWPGVWGGLWSAPVGAASSAARIDVWSPACGWDEKRRGGGGGAWAPPAVQALIAASPQLVPALERPSTFPEWATESLMVAPALRRREVDPALLALVSKSTKSPDQVPFVENRGTLRLRPNSYIYGRRKGYVDADPRGRAPGASSLHAPALNAGGEGGDGGDGDGGGDGGDGGGEGDAEGEGGADDGAPTPAPTLEEEPDDDAASISTGASLLDAYSGGNCGGGGGAPPPTPLSKRRGRAGHVPRAYARPPLLSFKPGAFVDVDFGRYNPQSPFAGLEEVGPNSFVNAPVQLLFFARGLRRTLQQHLCTHPACVACELRFIWDQLCCAPALLSRDCRAATAATLIRALAFVPEARRQGLLHPGGASGALDPTRRMDALLRVVVDKVAREVSGANGEAELPRAGVLFVSREAAAEDGWRGRGGGGGRGGKKRAQPPLHGGGEATPVSPLVAPPAATATVYGPAAPLPADLTPPPNPLDALFSTRTVTFTTCAAGHVVRREGSQMVIDLVAVAPPADAPSPPAAAPPPPTFAATLASSLFVTKRVRAHCEKCGNYVAVAQERIATSAPPLLLLNTGLDANSEAPAREAWQSSREWVAPAVVVTLGGAGGEGGARRGVAVEAVGAPPAPLPADFLSASRARYDLVGAIVHVAAAGGRAAVAPSPAPAPPPAFSDAEAEDAAVANFHYVSVLKVSEEGAFAGGGGAEGDAWFVFNDIRVTRTSEAEALDFAKPWKTPTTLLYQRADHEAGRGLLNPSLTPWLPLLGGSEGASAAALAAAAAAEVVAAAAAPVETAGGGADACAPTSGEAAEGSGDACAPADAPPPLPGNPLALASHPLATSAVGRARLACGYLFPHPLYPSPLTADCMRVPPTAFSLPPSIPHQPLLGVAPAAAGHVGAEAVPREGALAALDAEFVLSAQERAMTRADGSRRVIAKARMMPGRVTVVVPGQGGGGGAPPPVSVLMDEHIVATTRVWDHLTRFSGLHAGDLDTATSPHRLHAFKATYLRLRCLLDGGAVFVGHGLRKDSHELGVLVPPAQAADTVRLWHLPGNRFLSLRFLASFILGLDIQGTVHDSAEDALVALRLYEAWARVRAAAGQEGVDKLLHALYAVGRASGWRAATAGGGAEAAAAAAAAAERATQAERERHAAAAIVAAAGGDVVAALAPAAALLAPPLPAPPSAAAAAAAALAAAGVSADTIALLRFNAQLLQPAHQIAPEAPAFEPAAAAAAAAATAAAPPPAPGGAPQGHSSAQQRIGPFGSAQALYRAPAPGQERGGGSAPPGAAPLPAPALALMHAPPRLGGAHGGAAVPGAPAPASGSNNGGGGRRRNKGGKKG